ncbi:uncharacterized protein IUM83_18709 [Phytophthora cinnamomi]|uniref:uncharacterized protein n=1 Tax=Phytophthora cinnamomi TaxID=4785 RepID=UPI00355A749E|nr:hypothetical protein IUM83_18709 [Phytophthora cinnamomi]
MVVDCLLWCRCIDFDEFFAAKSLSSKSCTRKPLISDFARQKVRRRRRCETWHPSAAHAEFSCAIQSLALADEERRAYPRHSDPVVELRKRMAFWSCE